MAEIGPETQKFLFKVFYPFVGFRPKARFNMRKAWRQNLKVLLDWGQIEWDEEDLCLKFCEVPQSMISIKRRTLVLPDEYAKRREEFFPHLDEAMDSNSWGFVFPPSTESKLVDWLDISEEVEDKSDFQTYKENILEEFGPIPHKFVMISKDSSGLIEKAITDTKLWRDHFDFVE